MLWGRPPGLRGSFSFRSSWYLRTASASSPCCCAATASRKSCSGLEDCAQAAPAAMSSATMRIDSRIAELRYRRVDSMWNVVGQTSRSARVFQDPLFDPNANRPTWTSAAGLESCPTNTLWALALGLLLLAAPSMRAQTPAKEQFDDLAHRAEADRKSTRLN